MVESEVLWLRHPIPIQFQSNPTQTIPPPPSHRGFTTEREPNPSPAQPNRGGDKMFRWSSLSNR